MLTANRHLSVIGFLVTLMSIQPSFAETNTPNIDARQKIQQQRIKEGMDSGQLTPREARHLEARQNRIGHAEEAAKADGIVTKEEKIHLTEKQNQANREILRKKHNKRTFNETLDLLQLRR